MVGQRTSGVGELLDYLTEFPAAMEMEEKPEITKMNIDYYQALLKLYMPDKRRSLIKELLDDAKRSLMLATGGQFQAKSN